MRYRFGTMIGALLSAALLLSCAPVPCASTQAASAPAAPAAPCARYREAGTASWYGREFHGRKTASGELFDMYASTAAHRTLPFGTMLRVINLDNFRSVRVKVNDRGPFARSRVIELSLGAARELGFVEAGTARVRIEAEEPVCDAGAVYTIHAASFLEEESALSLKDRLVKKKFEQVVIDPFETRSARSYRVRVGSFPSEEKAERVAAKLTLEGLEPLVIRKDN